MTYAELAITSNFSFLRGASHPEEYAVQAAALGLAGIGIADRNSVAGVVRAHSIAKQHKVRLAVGARLVFADGSTPDILAYPSDKHAWARLARLLSLGKQRAEKGECYLGIADLLDWQEGLNLIVMPPEDARTLNIAVLHRLRGAAPGRVWLGANHLYQGDDARRLARLDRLAKSARLPLLAN
ncbi:MAG: PHP domain-containing protein, partial [Alphaproteobacteria bacterium]|nr:PHP domain-containing protein [Alphaproteobacteria bacterium]